MTGFTYGDGVSRTEELEAEFEAYRTEEGLEDREIGDHRVTVTVETDGVRRYRCRRCGMVRTMTVLDFETSPCEPDESEEQLVTDGGTETELVNQRHTDEFDVNIGRGNSGRAHMNNTPIGEPGWLGNPYKASTYGRKTCIRRFKADFEERIEEDTEFREAVEDLRGKTLACWCVSSPTTAVAVPHTTCHGEVILDYLSDGRQALIADGGTELLEPGDIATDRETRDGDPDTIVVVNRPDALAHEFYIEATGRTVAAHNQDYSPESPVIEAAYVDDMDATMPRDWREVAAIGLPELVRQCGVSTYAFPEARVERIEDGGGEEGEA